MMTIHDRGNGLYGLLTIFHYTWFFLQSLKMTVATQLLIVSLSPYRYLSGYVAALVFSFLLIIMIMHFTTFTHHLHPSYTPYTTDTTDVHVPCILMLCIF